MPNRKSGKGGMGGKLLTKGDRDPYKNETTVGGWKDESRFLSYMLSVRLRTEGWTSFAKHLFLFLCTASYEGLIRFIRQIGFFQSVPQTSGTLFSRRIVRDRPLIVSRFAKWLCAGGGWGRGLRKLASSDKRFRWKLQAAFKSSQQDTILITSSLEGT